MNQNIQFSHSDMYKRTICLTNPKIMEELDTTYVTVYQHHLIYCHAFNNA